MKKESLKKLKVLLDCNKKWPLIIEGVESEFFKNDIIVPANLDIKDMCIIPTESDYKYPAWIIEMMLKSKKSKKTYLVIDGLDEVEEDHQENFVSIIKNNGINGYSFPEGTQVIIPIKNGNQDKISNKIYRLCLHFTVE